jgi:hypothetical protein
VNLPRTSPLWTSPWAWRRSEEVSETTRFGAFAIHLGISLVIFFVLGYLILFHWYPDFFFASDGGWQGIRIIAAVDLALGPTLTLIVYKKGKPSLRFDLSVIALIQAVCLAGGIWVVHAERPIAMVFSDGFFASMSAGDYEEAGQPVPDLSRFDTHPAWVSVILPEDLTEQASIRRKAYEASIPLRTLGAFYQPFSVDHVDVSRDGMDRTYLTKRDREAPFLEDFFARHDGTMTDYLFLPFGTRYSLSIMALRLEDNELLFLELPFTAEDETDDGPTSDQS